MMYKGVNLAESSGSYRSARPVSNNIVVFISHISIDKNIAIAIGSYIQEAGFDIYLDVNDPALQRAVTINDPNMITQCIDRGLDSSSHVLCLVSESTKNSWWVPYEIGYGKKGKKNLATLKLKSVSYLPEYLRITQILNGIQELNKYLEGLLRQSGILNESMYRNYYQAWGLKASSYTHPLIPYLNQ